MYIEYINDLKRIEMTRKKNFKLKRLSMFIPEEVHEDLQKIAKKRYETITNIVLQGIIKRIIWEKEHE